MVEIIILGLTESTVALELDAEEPGFTKPLSITAACLP
jgi:hypothetical protein